MGGSILGAEAIYNFLKKVKKKFYFFNNIDENKIKEFKQKRNYFKNSIYRYLKVWLYCRDNC